MQQSTVTERPLVRRIGSRVKAASYRLLTPLDRLVRGPQDALLPPAHLRIYYYGTLRGEYHGIEIHPEAIAWCQRAITRRHPTFHFHHADVISRAYNPHGQLRGRDYIFPFSDKSFDFIFLASVFTHMLPDDVEHYVREISRVLAPGGVCVASYFLLNDETRGGVGRHQSFMSFDVSHSSGLCQLHDAAVPEAAVALEERFVERIHEEAGLRFASVRRGGWWDGRAHDQDVVAAMRRE